MINTEHTSQPIAIVGMACRFPEAGDLNSFWDLLRAGKSGITEGTPGSGKGRVGELFPDPVERKACRFGGYLTDLELFDASFFRISPVEAQFLDPQQRLMLEVSWHALEDACINPDTLKGSRAGVYAGISNNEYRGLILGSSDISDPAASLYAVTGTSFNTAIGRVSYALGLEGPALAVDTACSSSLVAVHQAVSGLQEGETDLALAGGVHTILSGQLLEFRANAGMLSPDGRCATFDAAANGYVRGEGCGIIVLKRLRDAVSDGNRIWGVIRSVATNQDGASPGLTVPSGNAQQQVISAALHKAGLSATDIDYVEAHGTGTEVGDPIEAQATGAAYSYGREANTPLLIGSVKTNIGHLEAAAGVAAIIKVLLSMQHEMIPQHLNFQTPSPEIPWDQLPLKVVSSSMEWPDQDTRPKRAGVSGFGWSGTNAHLILEEFRPEIQENRTGGPIGGATVVPLLLPEEVPVGKKQSYLPRTARLLPLAAKSSAALGEEAAAYLKWIESKRNDVADEQELPSSLLADMAWSASVGRSHLPRRRGIVFESTAQLYAKLEELAAEYPDVQSYTSPKVAFLFTGQGSQWTHMGEVLYTREPAFRTVLEHLEDVFAEERGASLLDVMFGRSTEDLRETQWAQPAIYALQCALVALWNSLGIRPDVVIGHSVGEFAAALIAGVFSQEAGMRLITRRSKVLHSLPGSGIMAAIFAPRFAVEEAVQAYNRQVQPEEVSIAAYNGAHQVVSGTPQAVEYIAHQFESNNVRVSRLRTSHAFHSPLVEPALDELEGIFEGIEISPPSLTLVSNVTGQLVGSDQRQDSEYWRKHARNSVAFAQGVQTLSELEVNTAIEVGPHSVLGPMLQLSWPDASESGSKPTNPPTTIPTLVRPSNKEDESDHHIHTDFLHAAAQAYESGLPVTFEGLYAGESRCRISIPAYPFQREHHWVSRQRSTRRTSGHPLLGNRLESASGEIIFESELFSSDPSWLAEHMVYDRIIAPGALYGTLAAAAALEEGYEQVIIKDMQFYNPMVFTTPPDGEELPRKVQVSLKTDPDDTSTTLHIYSTSGDEGTWTQHAECRLLQSAPSTNPPDRVSFDTLTAGQSRIDLTGFYSAKVQIGVALGPSFRTLNKLHSGRAEAVAEISLSSSTLRTALHPLLLDGCFQAMSAASREILSQTDTAYLPFGWEQLTLLTALPEQIICHARLGNLPDQPASDADSNPAPEVLTGDLKLYDLSGKMVGAVDGFVVKRATRSAMMAAAQTETDLLYEVSWHETAAVTGGPSADFLVAPTVAAHRSEPYAEYLEAIGVNYESRLGLLRDLQKLAYAFALSTLENLGWQRRSNETWEAESLREKLGVLPIHKRLFRRILELLSSAGILEEKEEHFHVLIPDGKPLPDIVPTDKKQFAADMLSHYPHGSVEIQLFQRCVTVLDRVLIGEKDPLEILFGGEEPTPADLYSKAPVARAVNTVLSDAVSIAIENLPSERPLRILEVGAGTGSATAAVLPCLSGCSYDYMYTDISAGFFADAETLFGGEPMQYRMLNIEKDPLTQGFDAHSYDLILASNVLHATRYLDDTLKHCLTLLAPSGELLALENFRPMGWLDLTFGQLDGWWRFADDYRPHHALASPDVWKQALLNAGFVDIATFGLHPEHEPDRGIVVAQGPEKILSPTGMWVLLGDLPGVAEDLAVELQSNNQHVTLTTASPVPISSDKTNSIQHSHIEPASREAWRELFTHLPQDIPLQGVVHLLALDGHGVDAETSEIEENVQKQLASALALSQALIEEDVTVEKGVFLVTSGAQILEKEQGGKPAGAALWGLGKVIAHEADSLQARLIDLDPSDSSPVPVLINELLYPDKEKQIIHRYGNRHTARLMRIAANTDRLSLPQGEPWRIQPIEEGSLDDLLVETIRRSPLDGKQVRVAIEAVGLNFWDMFRAIGVLSEGLLGGEMYGKVVEIGPDVSDVAIGDYVVGLAFGTFASEAVTHEAMLAPAPQGLSKTSAATIPTTFTSAELTYRLSGIARGEKILIHSGAGGTGMAAVYLAQAAGAEVFATCSPPKQVYLHSIGVKHVFNSRNTEFGTAILDITGGSGVDVVVNSLTSPGFIEASLSCLARGGRFIELARADILTEEEMAQLRPDVHYSILKLDVLKESAPEEAGDALKTVIERFETGQLAPLVHTQWPMASVGQAMLHMRNARHIGKIVLTLPPLQSGKLRADRTYLVTGGLGGIGSALAPFLIERGAGTIVLNGRRDPDPDIKETIRELQDKGHAVHVEIADVTDQAALKDMLTRMDQDLPPLGGVIHSVGVLSDASLTNMSWAQCEQVLRPKILGAWNLHRLTLQYDLDMFILFSSVAGVIGNRGQANHAAANAFLDQLALMRRTMGLPGQAIAWGAWSGIGEAEEHRERIAKSLAARGVSWITPEMGFKALDTLLRQDLPTSVVTSVDWPVFGESLSVETPLLTELLDHTSQSEHEELVFDDNFVLQLREMPHEAREARAIAFLQQEIQAVLRLPKAPEPETGFFDLGMDSLMAVEVRTRLNRIFAGEYVAPNTIIFDYPNIARLAHHLVDELCDTEPVSKPVPAVQIHEMHSEADPIAVVGMACRFPGAPDLESFWQLLQEGKNAISESRPPGKHWHGVVGDPAADKNGTQRGGFIEEIEKFDAEFFDIRPIEARSMDPCQRMVLETTWHALEDAGINPLTLNGTSTGVYIGIGNSEYREVLRMRESDDGLIGTMQSIVPSRLSFFLGLTGPAVPLDVTCASSLAAVDQAVTALRQGNIDVALVGGVQANLSHSVVQFMQDLGMLSKNGSCSTFDRQADGFVRGEGCGIIVLKRLSNAQTNGDRIWGLIRGAAMNQNGASAGLTVPKGSAQEEVIRSALSCAGLAASDVDYLEAHGTGSQLGDPIEVQAAATVYGEGRASDQPLLLGTVKTNIGHLECASGIAGIIKVTLAMHHQVIPRQLHFSSPNPLIDWDALPVRVVSENLAWPSTTDHPPRAAISAFGFSGANAHVIVEKYADTDSEDLNEPQDRTAWLLPLSAKSFPALFELEQRYISWLDQHMKGAAENDSNLSKLLSDMAWTASTGRSHLACRASIVFDSASSLQAGLDNLVRSSIREEIPATPSRIAFLFGDQDSNAAQHANQLCSLLGDAAPFTDRLNEVAQEIFDTSLSDLLSGDLTEPTLRPVFHFVAQACLYELWKNIGILPSFVLGEGIGTIASAYSSGIISLDTALRIAVQYGECSTSGAEESATLKNNLKATLRDSTWSAPRMSILGESDADSANAGQSLDMDHWIDQLASPTTNHGNLHRRCKQHAIDVVINLDGKPGISEMVSSTSSVSDSGNSLRTGRGIPQMVPGIGRGFEKESDLGVEFLHALGTAYEAGLNIDFSKLFTGKQCDRISLPLYPFQRDTFWVE